MAKIFCTPPFQEFALGLALRGGTMLKRNFFDSVRHTTTTRAKKHALVTASDREVHQFAVAKIQQYFPDHNIVSEEGAPIERGSAYTWVIDPLDGTRNYTIANPFFCTSVTLLKNNQPIVSAIYAPLLNEIFVAEKGQPARLNERVIQVSNEKRLARAVLSFSYFCRDEITRAQAMQLWASLEDRSCAMRHLGCVSLELAYIAAGRMDAQILVPPIRLWDVTAGMLLVQCAGGRITNFFGKPWREASDGFIASNSLLRDPLLTLVTRK
ncbi:MAG: inositol monophosphatase [Candidatus Kerfeldbacteria bacterium]|nr:inositol monophosphatase [Candidatus Kerfeldbacteria bacterium]